MRFNLKTQTETIGRLLCRTIDGLSDGTNPKVVVILCHGYGASGTDLVPIGEELLDQFPELRPHVRFVFPEAPLSLDDQGLPGGRAWWPIDLVKLQLAAATGRLSQDCPAGMADAAERLRETTLLICERSGLPLSKCIVGGFSQGAMLSTQTVLSLDENVAALVAMSGTLTNETEWKARAPHHAGLRVLQSHGTEDPLLPFAAAEWLRDLLSNSGAKVEFIPFAGGHQIPFEVFQQLAVRLAAVASDGEG
jgi:phospholipase/carboxylesterase